MVPNDGEKSSRTTPGVAFTLHPMCTTASGAVPSPAWGLYTQPQWQGPLASQTGSLLVRDVKA